MNCKKHKRGGRRFGLRLNEQKTSYMIIGDTHQYEELYLTVKITDGRGYNFERVKEFTYLGVEIEENEKGRPRGG